MKRKYWMTLKRATGENTSNGFLSFLPFVNSREKERRKKKGILIQCLCYFDSNFFFFFFIFLESRTKSCLSLFSKMGEKDDI